MNKVICIDNTVKDDKFTTWIGLVINEHYVITKEFKLNYLINGYYYPKNLFIPLSEYRDRQIDSILE